MIGKTNIGDSAYALSLEEIEASTDLSGKIPSAQALLDVTGIWDSGFLANSQSVVACPNINKYKMVMVVCTPNGSRCLTSTGIPVAVFKLGVSCEATFASELGINVLIRYRDDTHITIEEGSGGWGCRIFLY